MVNDYDPPATIDVCFDSTHFDQWFPITTQCFGSNVPASYKLFGMFSGLLSNSWFSHTDSRSISLLALKNHWYLVTSVIIVHTYAIKYNIFWHGDKQDQKRYPNNTTFIQIYMFCISCTDNLAPPGTIRRISFRAAQASAPRGKGSQEAGFSETCEVKHFSIWDGESI